jgi:hypothetical protein
MIDQPGLQGFELRPKFTEIGEDKLIGSGESFDDQGRREDRYYILTTREGQIADMRACGSWRQAKRFAKRSSPSAVR